MNIMAFIELMYLIIGYVLSVVLLCSMLVVMFVPLGVLTKPRSFKLRRRK